MNESMQKLSAVAESSGAALKSMVEIALDTSEAMFELNMSLARQLSAGSREPFVGGMLPPGSTGAHAGPHQLGLGTDYVRNLNDILSRAQAEIARVHLDQMNDLGHSLSALAGSLSTNGPANSVEMLDQFRLAMVQVSDAYEQLFQSARNVVSGATVANEAPLRPERGAAVPRRSSRGAS